MRKTPAAARKCESAARFLTLKKKKAAAIKTTRKPGISLGSSKMPLAKSLISKVSSKKLLKMEFIMAAANANKKTEIIKRV